MMGKQPWSGRMLKLVGVMTIVWMSADLALALGPTQSVENPYEVLAQSPTDRHQAANELVLEGNAAFQQGQFAAAAEAWRQAIAIYDQLGNLTAVVNGWQQVGFAETRLGNWNQAIAAFQQSVDVARTIANPEIEQAALFWLGVGYDNQQDFDNATVAFEASLVIAQAQADPGAMAEVLTRLGLISGWQADYATALQQYEQALMLAETADDTLQQMFILSTMGQALYAIGDYRQAIERHQASLGLAEDLNDEQWQWIALNNIGFNHYWLNEYAPAIDYYQQSLAILRQMGDAPGDEAWLLYRLGEVYFFVGDYRRAVDYQRQSLAIARTINDLDRLAEVLNSLGGTLYSLGDYEGGRAAYEEAIAVNQDVDNLNGQANALSGLATYYISVGDDRSALNHYEQSLALYREIGNRYNEGAALEAIGTTQLRLGNYDPAIAAFQGRLEISQADEERYGEGNALAALGLAALLQDDLPAAETYLQQSIEVLEAIRENLGDRDTLKVSLFDTQSNLYSLLQRVLVAQGRPEAALVVAEQGRARAFVERIAAQAAEATTPLSTEPPSLTEIQQIAARQNTTLVQYAWVEGRLDLDDRLTPQLYIWVVQPTGEITLRQGDLTGLDRPLTALVALSRESMGARGRSIAVVAAANPSAETAASASDTLQQLHRVLIDPIADLLPTDPDARVTIIPHQSLFLVPFPALQAADGSYLIDRHTLLSGPSIQVLGLTENLRQVSSRSLQQQSGAALVVGNPTMPPLPAPAGENAPVLASLPGAEQEARAIAAMLNTTPLIGDQATEPAVVAQMQQARMIHLATHGLLDWGDPQGLYQEDFPGAVALAPTQESDGLLTAAELLELDLKADLVILSACDTGQGRITGDGVIGLSRALMVAGVPSVVVSLWAVPDAPTASLMTTFYRQLEQGQDKAQALRQAMLATREQHPHPLDWAAFTLIGEAD